MKILFRYRFVLGCLLLLAPALSSSAQTTAGYKPALRKKIGHVRNLYEIDSGVYRSGQPSRKGFAALKKAGIREVLNLRRGENKDSLRSPAGELILHQIPLKARDLDASRVIEALRVIKNRQGPIVIHCYAGADRTGLISGLYRVIFDNWSKEAAIQELSHGGFHFHKRFREVPAFIRQANIDSIRLVLQQ